MLEIETYIGQTEPNGPEIALVRTEGRIDSSHAHKIGIELEFLLSQGITNIILNITEVEYLSTAGMREMIYYWKKAKREDGSLTIELKRNERCDEVICLAGLDTILDLDYQLKNTSQTT